MKQSKQNMQQTSLKGARVIDLTRVVAGPFSTTILADLGADVIKVERPGVGDDSRSWGPPFVGEASSYFLGLNRNRRSIAIDLQSPEGAQIIRDLVKHADVLVESFRPGVMERLGLGYETLRQINPSLVYCAISAYGQTGPYKSRPGYDLMISAMGGLMSVTGTPGGEPVKTGVALIDVCTGLHAAIGILGALYHRQATGEGQRVDASLLGSQLAMLINVASEYLIGGSIAKPQGSAHANVAPYQAFPSKDGWVLMGSPNDKLFGVMCDALGQPQWKHDPRFVTNGDRVAHREELVALISDVTRQHPTDYWVDLLSSTGAPVAPINTMDKVFQNEQVQHLAQVEQVEHPLFGSYPVVTSALRMSATPPVKAAPAPRLGQHSREVLSEVLGWEDDQIEKLIAAGVIEFREAGEPFQGKNGS
ncbi:CaiB/BaiF CoA transferase family protein [Chelativorans oligotrophicus]|jgi:crotonobetainyl-CoA:carnitine CoA-transferase CaiB-like acyl-CoA transferase|uniref:L-carnitine dehydratase/bile acid-inducible protein F n=1 Tax=Chelativorans sp. (strain BNC1) TaxID=266779 RepID=Q11E32_CHESB|nr:CoA transferase [Chelativorans oligotrophicus]